MRRLAHLTAPLLLLVLAALAPACGGGVGTTPDCANNITGDGVTPGENGCQQFAVCNGASPEDCCVEELGDPPDPNNCGFVICLFGYGVRNAQTEQCFQGGAGGRGGNGMGGGGAGGNGMGGGMAGAGGN
jgi:hypothetical protein